MNRPSSTKMSQADTVRAEAAIARYATVARTDLPDVAELLACWPLIFRGALGYLLSEFDYRDNRDSNTAVAARLLALMADRLERLRVPARTSSV